MCDDTLTYVPTYAGGSNVRCVFKMEQRALSGSAERKQSKEKEAKDAALVIATFFTRKMKQDDFTDNSGASSLQELTVTTCRIKFTQQQHQHFLMSTLL